MKSSDKNSNDGDAVCSYCKLDSSKNTKGKPEKLLVCQDCKTTAHPSCMKYSPKLAKKAYKGVWQCIDCKSCCVCDRGEDATTMLFCDACDRGYHMECHQPVLKDKPKGKWVCSDCDSSLYQTREMEWSSESESLHHECNRLYRHPQPSKDSIARVLSKEPKLDGNYYPDASEWSIDDVLQFFQSLGFTDDQIEVFREQEVDGKSILLMKRCDVVSGLSLKLGPALKLFQHIEGLQRAGFED
ncbi:hypothetical protein LOTGIDRAFT_120410 [Lottia gigantea]|uniref:PHD finger protein 10 n=1 Tax=Lottia gigantea TaxID=225164 RepID=V4ABW2_LOTGI|nr:hypothetical protein LOTGIDRAFT_120410 [Lottia gigantea]ESO92575.1 hypothetical protein LOTGIDRAFT_120410 [Lottia gigantea]